MHAVGLDVHERSAGVPRAGVAPAPTRALRVRREGITIESVALDGCPHAHDGGAHVLRAHVRPHLAVPTVPDDVGPLERPPLRAVAERDRLDVCQVLGQAKDHRVEGQGRVVKVRVEHARAHPDGAAVEVDGDGARRGDVPQAVGGRQSLPRRQQRRAAHPHLRLVETKAPDVAQLRALGGTDRPTACHEPTHFFGLRGEIVLGRSGTTRHDPQKKTGGDQNVSSTENVCLSATTRAPCF